MQFCSNRYDYSQEFLHLWHIQVDIEKSLRKCRKNAFPCKYKILQVPLITWKACYSSTNVISSTISIFTQLFFRQTIDSSYEKLITRNTSFETCQWDQFSHKITKNLRISILCSIKNVNMASVFVPVVSSIT